MRAVAVLGLVFACACSGPPASDVEVCRDVIGRICRARCPSVDARLGLTVNSDCTARLTTASTCITDDFRFENRDAFLSCRLPIIRSSDHVEATPPCTDVDEMFLGCPSLVQFFGGP